MTKSILTVLLLILSQAFYGQSNSFEVKWALVDSLEVKGKIKTALQEVNTLREYAVTTGNDNELIKASLYRWKFQKLTSEFPLNQILAELDSTVLKVDKVQAAILWSVKAKLLTDYFVDNRWQIQDISQTNEIEDGNIQTWSEYRFVKRIAQAYDRSLQHKKVLKNTPVEAVLPLIKAAELGRLYRPSLFDVLAHEAISFYTTNDFYFNGFGENELAFSEGLFSPSKEFRTTVYPSRDTVNFKKKALHLFQELEEIHAGDSNPDAFVFTQLDRLYFAQEHSKLESKSKAYEDALKALIETYSETQIGALVKFKLASWYRRSAPKHNIRYHNDLVVDSTANTRAILLCKEVIAQYPNSEGAQRCKVLKRIIEDVDVKAKAQRFTTPNTISRLRVAYKNVDTLELRIVKISAQYDDDRNLLFGKHELNEKFLDSNNVYFRKKYKMPGKKDYNFHSTELLLPALPAGTYVFFFTNNRLSKTHSMAFAATKVTHMAYLKTNFDTFQSYQFVDRNSGKPMVNIPVDVWMASTNVTTRYKTDKLGEIKVVKLKKNSQNRMTLLAVNNQDTLFSKNSIRRSYNYQSDDDIHDSKSLVYLDRDIYRPGQTVHYKGVLIQRKNGENSVVANEQVIVYIEGANGDELLEKYFRTNEFGSFSGSFQLPINALTGEFTIYVDEGDEDSEFWDTIDEFNDREVNFRVEEYKRPTFEATFDKITQTFKPNDSIFLTGNAKAYLGSHISNAKVNYTVVRSEIDYSRYRYGGGQRRITEGSTITDIEGNFRVSFLDSITFSSEKSQTIYSYVVEASITDVNGETRTATQTVRVSYNNFFADLKIPKLTDMNGPLVYTLETKNLNNVPVGSEGTIKVYKQKVPKKVYKDRLWPAPQIQQISREDFERYFPNEPYIKTDTEVTKGELVFETQINSDGTFEASHDVSFSEGGNYIMDLVSRSAQGDLAEITKTFTVQNKKNKYLPDSQLFSHEVLNTDYKKDGFIKLRLQSCMDDLNVLVSAFSARKRIYANSVMVDGLKTIKIPIDKNESETIAIRLNRVRNSQWYEETREVEMPEEEQFLKIETASIRNKLSPGSEETWSFSIRSKDDKLVKNEVLATMYDMSLDEFVISQWPEMEFYSYNYSYNPRLETNQFFNTRDFIFRNREPNYSFTQRPFDRINFFGFDFKKGRWNYDRYVRSRKGYKPNIALKGNFKGVVLDENGLPLPGVAVVVIGSTVGTQTNFDGEFALDVSPNDRISVSYIGYLSAEFQTNVNPIYISLEADSEALEEVVVTGYGGVTKSKKALGYAVTTVSAESISSAPSRDIIRSLNGKVNGVQITEVADSSGVGVNFMIRSKSSLNSGSQPLFIVDGVPFDFGEYSTRLLNLNPKDVLSVDLLTGLDATTLYGQQGKNGVVIITTKKGMAELTKVKARENLDETAFFFPHLVTDKEGKVSFSFTAPEALTKWKFRLMTHTQNGVSGYLNRELVTQKELSLVPNAPRFLREKDTVVISVKISNLSGKPMVGNAVLELLDAVTLEARDTMLIDGNAIQSFTNTIAGNTTVSWRLAVPQGLQALQYRVLAKAGEFSDGEQNTLPVLTNRMLVTESIPLLVRAGTQEVFTLPNLKNNTSSTLSHHKMTLEYTTNPVWNALQSLPYLMEFEHECAEQTFSRYYANVLSAFVINSNPKIKEVFDIWKGDGSLQSDLEKNESLKNILIAETPWLRNAQSETEQKKRLALLFDAEKNAALKDEVLKKLGEMQNTEGAFPWFSGGRSNTYITRHIVAGFGHLKKLGVSKESLPMIDDAVDYLDIQLEEDFNKHKARFKKWESFYQQRRHLHFLYARSFYWDENPIPPSIEKVVSEIMRYQEKEWITLGVYEKAMLALIEMRLGNNEIATEILTALKENAVASKINGAYWKSNEWGYYWYQAPIETQALVIEAFTEMNQEDPFIEELKIWLLQQKRTNSWSTTKASAEAVYALLSQGSDLAAVENSVEIELGGATISEEKMNTVAPEAGTGYFKLNWNTEEITPKKASLKVKNTGTSVGFGGFYWQYFEDLDAIKESNKGGVLSVTKTLFKKGQDGVLLQLRDGVKVNVGDEVTVKLTVVVKSDMEYVHLKDLRASGFEPTTVLSGYQYQNGARYYQSTKDVATHFFFDSLAQGTYVIEYAVRANNGGNFSNGTATIQSMYAPEFSSHTKGRRVSIE